MVLETCLGQRFDLICSLGICSVWVLLAEPCGPEYLISDGGWLREDDTESESEWGIPLSWSHLMTPWNIQWSWAHTYTSHGRQHIKWTHKHTLLLLLVCRESINLILPSENVSRFHHICLSVFSFSNVRQKTTDPVLMRILLDLSWNNKNIPWGSREKNPPFQAVSTHFLGGPR